MRTKSNDVLRIVHISDPHNEHSNIEVPGGDVVICSGDLTNSGTEYEVEAFMDWWMDLPHKHKIIIAGNHDFCFDVSKYNNVKPFWISHKMAQYGFLSPHNHYLEGTACTIDNVKFYGTPYNIRKEGKKDTWAFNVDSAEISKYWADIHKNTDVLITHMPPFGKLDWAFSDNGTGRIGCERLRYFVKTIKPKLHLFGHVHDDYGMIHDNDTMYCNGSIVNRLKVPCNYPQTIDINKKTKQCTYVHFTDISEQTIDLIL